MHPVDFMKQVREYDLLSPHLALNLVAALLPWFEIFCGFLLLLGVAVRGAVVMLLIMLGAFTGGVLVRALAIHGTSGLPFCAIKFDCGCGAGETLICGKLGENLALIILCTVLLLVRRHRLSLRPSLF